MKRFLFLLLALLLTLCGCRNESPVLQDPVRLYYRVAADRGDIPTELIGFTEVEGVGRRNNPISILNEYLLNTPDEAFQRTFPQGTHVYTLEIDSGKAFITVSQSMADYDGIRLTVACACLSKTVMELTGADTVYIKAQNTTLGNSEQIVMDDKTLLTLDIFPETT